MSDSTTSPIAIPSSTSHTSSTSPLLSPDSIRKTTTSPPIDPSKLNNEPAPLPPPPVDQSTITPIPSSSTGGGLTSPPLRSPQDSVGAGAGAPLDSAYLDTGAPIEPASHPTIAETGVPASNGENGPGPRQGQLKRVEKKDGGDIIKLGSLGGEGLKMKPPTGSEEEL
ncbi:hypothetical protein CI109_104489 [Kwoniella shandongensis]|uniref:Uncharacterized protein n=1 Tax=Kwoniella shandongensis TaxID=1734106 RepID=A0A5M6BSA6_9TREE|nr:uncharacterized protein CI109_006810 [Kwoniella shandongensis]KAA5524860.1 hypothetical protein CI109_006810 [Kwoniella shandongensis]